MPWRQRKLDEAVETSKRERGLTDDEGRRINSALKMTVPEILYEDNHLLAVNKPAGLLVQGDRTGDRSVLDIMKNHIKIRDSKPGNVFIGLPHRLDRPSSGALILAKTSKALTRLTAAFRDSQITKVYWAVVQTPPRPLPGELIHHLRKDGRTNTSRRAAPGTPGAKEARLRCRLIGTLENYSLLEIELITGRHHQIRAQLSIIGCPVKGDIKYGARRTNPLGGIHLHARRLEVPHPVRGSRVIITAPLLPDTLWNHFNAQFGDST